MPEALERAVFLDVDTVDVGDLDRSGLRADLPEWRWYGVSDPTPVEERLYGAHVAVSNKVLLDADRLDRAAARGLRLVCLAATGTNNVDLDAARRLGVAVANARGYATPAVVQHVFALILALLLFLREVFLASAGLILGQYRDKGPVSGARLPRVADPGPQDLGGT